MNPTTVSHLFHVPTPPNPFRGRSYPLILSDSCGIACSIQGDATLPRFTPESSRAPMYSRSRSWSEAMARRADAHQRARILRDAAKRSLRYSRFYSTGFYATAADRQERTGNGTPDTRHSFAPHKVPTVLVAGEFADAAIA